MNAEKVACREDFHHGTYQIITRSSFSNGVPTDIVDLFGNNRGRCFVRYDNTCYCYLVNRFFIHSCYIKYYTMSLVEIDRSLAHDGVVEGNR